MYFFMIARLAEHMKYYISRVCNSCHQNEYWFIQYDFIFRCLVCFSDRKFGDMFIEFPCTH